MAEPDAQKSDTTEPRAPQSVDAAPKPVAGNVDYSTASKTSTSRMDPADPENLRTGENFKILGGQYAVVLNAPWFLDGAVSGDAGSGLVNPAKMAEILGAMRDQGMLSWITPETIDYASRRIGIASTSAQQLKVRFNADSFAMVGLPPNSAAMVSFAQGALLVAIRANTAGLERGQKVTVTGESVARVYRAIETFTGLPIAGSRKVPDFAMYVGTDAFEKRIPGADLTYIFGPAWTKWDQDHRQRGSYDEHRDKVVGAISVDSSLTSEENGFLTSWLRSHLSQDAPPKAPTRDMLAIVHGFEMKYALHPDDRTRILERLRSGKFAVADARSLRSALDDAEFENDRHHAGLEAAPHDAAWKAPTIGSAIPAQLKVTNDVLIDGDELVVELSVDWASLSLGDNSREQLRKGFSMRVEWVVGRSGKIVHSQLQQTTVSEQRFTYRLALEDGESAGTWRVDAFVRSNSFSATHLPPVLAEAKSAAARMRDLRTDAIGDVALNGSSHQFPMGTFDQGMGGASFKQYWGTKYEGAAFSARTPAERMAIHGEQITRLEQVLAYLRTNQPEKHRDAIAAVEAQLVKVKEEHAALQKAGADGWRTFDVRASYLSRTEGIATGTLDVYAMTKRDGASVVVRLADHSKRLGDEVLTYESTEPTFEEALAAGFTKLCKAYPKGTVALWAEGLDANGEKPTGRTVGFELETSSVWKWVKDKAFAPVVQIATAAVMVPLMIFAPAVAVPLIIANAVTSTIQNVDELATRAQNNTLTTKRVGIGLAQIGLNWLPLVKHARMARMVQRIEATTAEKVEMGAYWVIQNGSQALLAVPQYYDALRRIEEEDVGAISQMYVAMIELEKSTHPSDPRLAQARAAIETRAASVRDATYKAFNETAGTTAMFMWLDAASMAASSKSGNANRPHRSWEPAHDANPNIGKRPSEIEGDDFYEHDHTPESNPKTASRTPKGRVTEPVEGLYDSVDPTSKPTGWTIIDKITTGDDPNVIIVKTHVELPDGTSGWIERGYDKASNTMIMKNAFLEMLPSWIGEGKPLVAGKGMPTVTYLTIRQMHLLKVGYGQVKTFKMNTIQNVLAVVQLESLIRKGLPLDQAVAKTHSVEYAATSIQQSGHVIASVKVDTSTMKRRELGVLYDHYDFSPEQRSVLLAQYGVKESDVVMFDYNILLTVVPATGGVK